MSTKTSSKSWENRGRRPLVPIGDRGVNANRKAAKRLEARVKDYASMMNNALGRASKAPHGAFHQPGSYSK